MKYYYTNYNDDRFIALPFLAGAVLGGATVGLLTPRYNTYPVYYTPSPYPYYSTGYSYSGYYY